MRVMPSIGADLGYLSAGMGEVGPAASGAAPIDYVARYGAVAHYALDEASGANDAIAALGGVNLEAAGSPASAAGQIGTARVVTGASGANFNAPVGQEAWLAQGDFDYWFAVWAYPTVASPGSRESILSKDGGSSGYFLGRQPDTTPIYVVRQAGGADCGRIASATVVPANAFAFLMCYFDSVAREVGISVNGGAFTPFGTTGSPGGGSTRFRIGDSPGTGEPFAGRVDEFSWGKQPPLGIGTLKTEIRDRLYAAGAGRAFPWS
jgi:hypothetical protein